MAGLTGWEARAGDRHFWTWREAMYHFLVGRLGRDVLGDLGARVCRDARIGVHARRRVPRRPSRHSTAGRTPTSANSPRESSTRRQETGIGLTLLPVFYAHASFGGAPRRRLGQRRFICNSSHYARLLESACERRRAHTARRCRRRRAAQPARGRIRTGIGALSQLASRRAAAPPHRGAAARSRRLHCVERPATGRVAPRSFARRCALVADSLDAHDAGRARGHRARRAVVGLCPITEADLGDGIFPGCRTTSAGGGSASARIRTC